MAYDMRPIIRKIIMMVTLLMSATGTVWALDSEDIIINKIPQDTIKANNQTVVVGGTAVVTSVSGRVVTLEVIPNTLKGYTINEKMITVEPMIDPAASRRAPIVASTIEVSRDGTSNNYTFTLPEKYGKAYVTVRFFKPVATEGFIQIYSLDEITSSTGKYELVCDVNASGFSTIASFSGTLTAQAKADGTFPVIMNLTKPLFNTATDATISNIMLQSVGISQTGYVGAICCTANGTTRIYNCGILPTTLDNASSSRSTVASTNNHCGSLVGYLDGSARVINCFSFANVSAPANNSKVAGGLVGYNTTCSDQREDHLTTMVMNCMFYGDITQGHIKRPVYGGERIKNENTIDSNQYGINNYNYFSEEDATFTASLDNLNKYNCTWPVAKKYLMRFEVYRNLLNSNRRLCTWWVSGTYNTAPTDDDVTNVGVAKWVLDPTIAPYPILKKWGKYYSTFDMDPNNVYHAQTNTTESRATAKEWEGKSYNKLSVTINGGDNNSGASASRDIMITDMDTLGYDYCAKKIQLPYYNEVFGNPNGTTWAEKYGKNYTNKVVTGWKITAVSGGTPGTFDGSSDNAWETGYNFADRKCTNKDKYSESGRVFAQGGYYYVPDGVDGITIEAYWGDAVYLCNDNRYLDRVNNAANNFTSAGKLPDKINGISVKTSLSNAVSALKTISDGASPGNSVYDQAIVLVGNYQQNNFHSNITLDGSIYDTNAKPFTIMSADFDFDNEPDFCFQAGMKGGGRINAQPIRFDFLMVPDLTMAVRVDGNYYGMRIFCPQGHFEITETSYMYTTQFEYDMRPGPLTNNDYKKYRKHEAPMILNGGEHFQIVSAEQRNGNEFPEATLNQTATWRLDRTSYFLMGGKVYMKAFTPGTHGNRRMATRHCAVNAIGGEYPEFYLSGMFNADFYNMTDNPHAYLDGGKFGTIAGAGMESVGAKDETEGGDVTFKINRSWIKEFYGGGINANRPVTGTISVTCDNSIVHKYCGGPKVGDMSNTKSITTIASNTVFDQFFGGGNGGTNNERKRIYDSGGGVTAPSSSTDSSPWNGSTGGFDSFSPFNYVDGGYETEFEFELLPYPSGSSNVVKRTYHYLASFARTTVAPVSNTITDCTFNGNFYGGGNLGAVAGPDDATDPIVTSTLKGHTIVHGSVFGAGFSASIPSFRVHDEATAVFPYRDKSGYIHDGKLNYGSTYYTWINVVPAEWEISPAPTTSNPTFQHNGQWYVYTTANLTNLGSVNGDVSLTIEGTTEVDDNVYGGGDQSAVEGNSTVTVQGSAKVGGSVYGGGNLGSIGTYTVSGSTYSFTEGTGACTVNIEGGTVGSNVFGGGKGIANTFQCEKGMVYQANVNVSGGTVNGTVYGGGEIGRVENDTEVKIGDGEGSEETETPTPIIHGNVFGAGKGLNTHGYSALVRGNSEVTVEGDAKVDGSVYGGGEISSVGRYTLVSESNQSQYPGLEIGMPGSLANSGSGECTVIVQGHATIGPNGMQMTATGGPDDAGHIFGAGMGATPQVYTYDDKDNMPKRMMSYTAALYPDDKEGITWEYADDEHQNVWEYFDTEAKYLTFIETMALTTQTEVTVDGSAFVKGSVYGGSENGFVQHDTKVMIKGGQIGAGAGESSPYADNKFINPATTPVTSANALKACATWTYTENGAPYDKFAGTAGYDAKGGAITATDGHTFYGNVFGGGSGFYPYAPGKWHRKAGSVGGDTQIEISGGHILSNVYGGNEQTDVGTYTHDANDAPIIADGGTCTIVMTGGTIGVPRTATAIEALPTIGHLYGAGKGDKRILFNTWTNVGATSVSVSGGIVYGNVYGGGEDGHVMGNAVTTISETDATNKPTVIGSVGDAGLDGNVFGGGQGSPTALTAGVMGGNANLNVQGGHMLGSVYGGGRIASVGTYFAMASDPRYGKMQEDVDDDEATTEVDESVTHGHLTVNLTGGTIEQNVYGGCMGTKAAANANAEAIAFAAKLGMSKTVTVNLNQGVADNVRGCAVKGDIFGCNNTNSSPQQDVTVHIYATQNAGKDDLQTKFMRANDDFGDTDEILETAEELGIDTDEYTDAGTDEAKQAALEHIKNAIKGSARRYDVHAVYGGGNLAAYKPIGPDASAEDDDGKNTEYSTSVTIDGCGLTSIQTVYGGGNAASTPATSLTVNGTYEIEEVFGGGNGKDAIDDNTPNPGANVGFYDYSAVESTYPTKADRQKSAFTNTYVYGSGKASVNIYGGTVHRVFGGSNTKGNVRITAVTMLEDQESCEFCVDEAYGGGKSAPMDAEAKLHMACIPGLSAAYGGAEAADILGDVTLNITNGTFDRVFGGNNLSGTISGSITVNIEETGCKPIIIGELYGGGNQAAYSVFGYKKSGTTTVVRRSKTDGTAIYTPSTPYSDKQFYADPQVNVKSFTSIGDVYGGGLGTTATMVGNPTVNVNVALGRYASDAVSVHSADFTTNGNYPVPSHASGKIGAINKVFGGGNAAEVVGNTNVNIGTDTYVFVTKEFAKDASVAGYYIRTGTGTAADPYDFEATDDEDTADENTTYYERIEVKGADIRDNVYGGGNNAAVTGNTNVVIGKKKVTE